MKKTLILLAVLFVLCLAATAVLAGDVLGENYVPVGDISKLYGNASSTNLDDKINGYDATNENGSSALFVIHTALDDRDWITDTEHPGGKYLLIQSKISVPAAVKNSDAATNYYMQFRYSKVEE